MNAGPNKTLTVFEVKKVEVGVVILIDLPNQNQFKIFYRFFMKKWINFSTKKTDTKSFFVLENVII